MHLQITNDTKLRRSISTLEVMIRIQNNFDIWFKFNLRKFKTSSKCHNSEREIRWTDTIGQRALQQKRTRFRNCVWLNNIILLHKKNPQIVLKCWQRSMGTEKAESPPLELHFEFILCHMEF